MVVLCLQVLRKIPLIVEIIRRQSVSGISSLSLILESVACLLVINELYFSRRKRTYTLELLTQMTVIAVNTSISILAAYLERRE